jgi:hypothetical protein
MAALLMEEDQQAQPEFRLSGPSRFSGHDASGFVIRANRVVNCGVSGFRHQPDSKAAVLTSIPFIDGTGIAKISNENGDRADADFIHQVIAQEVGPRERGTRRLGPVQ